MSINTKLLNYWTQKSFDEKFLSKLKNYAAEKYVYNEKENQFYKFFAYILNNILHYREGDK